MTVTFTKIGTAGEGNRKRGISSCDLDILNLNARWTSCTVVKEAIGYIHLKLREGAKIGERNLGVTTIKIQAKEQDTTT